MARSTHWLVCFYVIALLIFDSCRPFLFFHSFGLFPSMVASMPSDPTTPQSFVRSSIPCLMRITGLTGSGGSFFFDWGGGFQSTRSTHSCRYTYTIRERKREREEREDKKSWYSWPTFFSVDTFRMSERGPYPSSYTPLFIVIISELTTRAASFYARVKGVESKYRWDI